MSAFTLSYLPMPRMTGIQVSYWKIKIKFYKDKTTKQPRPSWRDPSQLDSVWILNNQNWCSRCFRYLKVKSAFNLYSYPRLSIFTNFPTNVKFLELLNTHFSTIVLIGYHYHAQVPKLNKWFLNRGRSVWRWWLKYCMRIFTEYYMPEINIL